MTCAGYHVVGTFTFYTASIRTRCSTEAVTVATCISLVWMFTIVQHSPVFYVVDPHTAQELSILHSKSIWTLAHAWMNTWWQSAWSPSCALQHWHSTIAILWFLYLLCKLETGHFPFVDYTYITGVCRTPEVIEIYLASIWSAEWLQELQGCDRQMGAPKYKPILYKLHHLTWSPRERIGNA